MYLTSNPKILSELCYAIDSICRNDLWLEQITSERDYVSNLLSHFRFPLGPFSKCSLVKAKTNPNNIEQIFGADSMIIFKLQDGVKVGMFEAKWPRLIKESNYAWDSFITSGTSENKGKSRFTTQLKRQLDNKNSGIVFWEQFFIEEKPGVSSNGFDKLGSSCILLNDAHKCFIKNKGSDETIKWSNSDFPELLKKGKNIQQIFEQILLCKLGKKMKVKDGKIQLLKSNEMEIPIIESEGLNKDNIEAIKTFMKENGIINYLSIDL